VNQENSRGNAVTKDELIEAYETWFSEQHWNLFGTLTFRGYASPSRADRIFRQWISEVKREDGTNDFRWIRVTERGACADNLHYHVLIGGWRGASKWPWVLRWDELAGDCILSYYQPHSHGIRYMLKEVCPGRDFEIEMELPPTSAQRQ